MEPRVQYTATSDGVSIAYATLGDGPPVVFSTRSWGDIHTYTTFEQFRPYFRALASRGWRAILYDGRGTGSSQRDATDFDLRARIRDLEAVIEAIGSDRFALCGNHTGGATAIVYAAEHPERVSRLILTNTFAGGGDYQQSTPALRVALDLLNVAEDEWEFYTLALANAVTAFSDIETSGRLAATIRAGVSRRAWLADREALMQTDVTATLGAIAMPTLVVHDRADTIGNFSAIGTKLASHIPSARFVATNDAVRAIDEFLREGEEPAVTATGDLASGTAIILFADIVDSTALTEQLGDAAFRGRARALDASLRRIVAEGGGLTIDAKTLGDGVLATFPAASQAIDAALRCSAAGEGQGLPLHLGLHAGDVIREQNNVFGGAVNIASRISALSEPGEVLVSDIVRGLARTSAGVVFDDRGEHELKGVGDAVRVYAVRSQG
jgi:class 3 adenylate cyclase